MHVSLGRVWAQLFKLKCNVNGALQGLEWSLSHFSYRPVAERFSTSDGRQHPLQIWQGGLGQGGWTSTKGSFVPIDYVLKISNVILSWFFVPGFRGVWSSIKSLICPAFQLCRPDRQQGLDGGTDGLLRTKHERIHKIHPGSGAETVSWGAAHPASSVGPFFWQFLLCFCISLGHWLWNRPFEFADGCVGLQDWATYPSGCDTRTAEKFYYLWDLRMKRKV